MFDDLFNERYKFKTFIIYVRKINNFREMDLRYFSMKNKPDFNFILLKIRRYTTTHNYTCHVRTDSVIL